MRGQQAGFADQLAVGTVFIPRRQGFVRRIDERREVAVAIVAGKTVRAGEVRHQQSAHAAGPGHRPAQIISPYERLED